MFFLGLFFWYVTSTPTHPHQLTLICRLLLKYYSFSWFLKKRKTKSGKGRIICCCCCCQMFFFLQILLQIQGCRDGVLFAVLQIHFSHYINIAQRTFWALQEGVLNSEHTTRDVFKKKFPFERMQIFKSSHRLPPALPLLLRKKVMKRFSLHTCTSAQLCAISYKELVVTEGIGRETGRGLWADAPNNSFVFYWTMSSWGRHG